MILMCISFIIGSANIGSMVDKVSRVADQRKALLGLQFLQGPLFLSEERVEIDLGQVHSEVSLGVWSEENGEA